MSDVSCLPQSLGQSVGMAPIRMEVTDAACLEHILFQAEFGITVATSERDLSHSLVEFAFTAEEAFYEL